MWRKESGQSKKLTTQREERVLKGFGHVERMEKERLVIRVYRANVEGNRVRGRPQRRWRDYVKEIPMK